MAGSFGAGIKEQLVSIKCQMVGENPSAPVKILISQPKSIKQTRPNKPEPCCASLKAIHIYLFTYSNNP